MKTKKSNQALQLEKNKSESIIVISLVFLPGCNNLLHIALQNR